MASPGSATGAAGSRCFGICPWSAALLVPTPKLQAVGSYLGADATHCNCSLGAPRGACLQTVPRCKHRFWGEGRGASRWMPLFSALAWEQCIAQLRCRVQSPTENLHEQLWGCQACLSQELRQQAKHRLLGLPVDRYGVVWLWEMIAELKAFSQGCHCFCAGAGRWGEGSHCPDASSQQAGIRQV